MLYKRLKKAVECSKWQGDDIIIAAIESNIVFWFFLLGLSIAHKDLSYNRSIPNLYIKVIKHSINSFHNPFCFKTSGWIF